MQLCGSLSILWHCLSLGLEWKLTFSSPVATAEFPKFADILSASLSQHHLSGFEIAQLEFHLITRTTAWSNSMKLSHPLWGHPRQAGHGGEVWQNVVHWRREWQTTSVFLPWEPHEQYENAESSRAHHFAYLDLATLGLLPNSYNFTNTHLCVHTDFLERRTDLIGGGGEAQNKSQPSHLHISIPLKYASYGSLGIGARPHPAPPHHILTCSMARAHQKSLELWMRRSNMWFWRICPRSTWAPVLIVFSTHLVLSSCWNF